MEYFIIKKTSDKKVIGLEYPQIQTMAGSVHKEAKDSLYNVHSNKIPDFSPNLHYFVMQSGAILTDVLSASMISYGFIVNSKVRDVLKQFKLPMHRFYPASVKYKDKLYEYYWFFYVSDVFDFINYERTAFYLTDIIGNRIDDIGLIDSAMDLRELNEKLPYDRDVNCDSIVFSEKLTNTYDMFKVGFGDYYTYASKRLVDFLNDADVKGFEFIPHQGIKILA